MGASGSIAPIWSRISRFFLYPLGFAPLLYGGVVAVLSVGLFEWSLKGLLIQLVLFVAFYRYCHAILEGSARGRPRPPPVSFELINSNIEQPFKEIGVFLLLGLIHGKLYPYLPPLANDIVSLSYSLCVPAIIMVVATTNSFLQAINPIALGTIMLRIGFPYLVLWGFMNLLWIGSAIVFVPKLMAGPDTVTILLYLLTTMYLAMVMFHMMGYLLYQHHEELGFDIDVDEDPNSRPHDAAEAIHVEVSTLLKEGDTVSAIERLQAGIRDEPGDLALHARLYALLRYVGDAPGLTSHGRRYVEMLLGAGRTRAAAEVYRGCRDLGAEFDVNCPDFVLVFAEALRDIGSCRLALEFIRIFTRAHRDHADVPCAIFLASKILCEDLRDDSRAIRVLDDLVSRYPQHPRMAEYTEYLATVRRIMSVQ